MSIKHSFVASGLALCSIVTVSACTTESANAIDVTGTNDSCASAQTDLAAGKVTFDFNNTASEVSELYVLRLDGSVVGEVENVTTGTSRKLTVSLVAGEYDLVCKPGQQGDGFSTRIAVTGEGGTVSESADRSIEIRATDHSFAVPDATTVKVGETIEFEMYNDAPEHEHEMEVFEPSGELLGEVGPTKPGEQGKATLTFTKAGTYRLVCGIDDHEALGMVAELVVVES